MLAFKSFGPGRTGRYQSNYTYPPNNVWTKNVKPHLCYSGFHVANSFKNLARFAYGEDTTIYLVEAGGDYALSEHDVDKASFERIRLLKRINFSVRFLRKTLRAIDNWNRWMSKEQMLREIMNNIRNPIVLNAVAKKTGLSKHLLTRSVTKVLSRRNKHAGV